jgi:hypothetical protein
VAHWWRRRCGCIRKCKQKRCCALVACSGYRYGIIWLSGETKAECCEETNDTWFLYLDFCWELEMRGMGSKNIVSIYKATASRSANVSVC